MRVFVTGGNGFIGSVVVRTLLEQGHQVTCLLRKTAKLCRLEGLTYQRVEGDVRDIDTLIAGMHHCDAVIHLASLSSWDAIESPALRPVVIGGTENVLAAAKQTGNLRVVFVSSVTALGGTPFPKVLDEKVLDEKAVFRNAHYTGKLVYAQCKAAAENLCLKAVDQGQEVVIVNPAEVYGPHDFDMVTAGNLRDFLTSKVVLVCEGGTSVVFVDDVADGIVRALVKGRSGQHYILGGDNLSLKDLARLTLLCAGKRAPIFTVPNPLIRVITAVAGRARIPLPYNPKVIPYATRYWYVDASKAQAELGVSFRSARDTLGPTVEWLREAC